MSAVLVERDPALADRAVSAAARAGLTGVEVRCGDASDPTALAATLPVDVLLLCGIFGNIEHAAVRRVVDVVPTLVAPGGAVLWTRGGSEPDRRDDIRGWFATAGLPEVSFDGAPAPFGVGVNRLPAAARPRAGTLPDRRFAFG